MIHEVCSKSICIEVTCFLWQVFPFIRSLEFFTSSLIKGLYLWILSTLLKIDLWGDPIHLLFPNSCTCKLDCLFTPLVKGFSFLSFGVFSAFLPFDLRHLSSNNKNSPLRPHRCWQKLFISTPLTSGLELPLFHSSTHFLTNKITLLLFSSP